MGAGIFDVTAELGVPLAEDELLALYLDDEPVDSPQVNAVWTLTYVIRAKCIDSRAQERLSVSPRKSRCLFSGHPY